MVKVEILQDKEHGLTRKLLIDGKDVTKGCMGVKFEVKPDEIATVTVTYAASDLRFNGEKL